MSKIFAISIIYHTQCYSILGWYLWSFKFVDHHFNPFWLLWSSLEKNCCYSDGTDLYEHIWIDVPLLPLSSFWWKLTALVICVCVFVMVLSIWSKVFGTIDWYGNVVSFV